MIFKVSSKNYLFYYNLPKLCHKIGNTRSSTVSSGGGVSQSSVGMGMGGGIGALFAGGVPSLKNRGGVEIGRSATEGSVSKKVDRRVSADWFGNLSSDQLAGELTPKPPHVIKTET